MDFYPRWGVISMDMYNLFAVSVPRSIHTVPISRVYSFLGAYATWKFRATIHPVRNNLVRGCGNYYFGLLLSRCLWHIYEPDYLLRKAWWWWIRNWAGRSSSMSFQRCGSERVGILPRHKICIRNEEWGTLNFDQWASNSTRKVARTGSCPFWGTCSPGN